MPNGLESMPAQRFPVISKANFDTPWIPEGRRLNKLRASLKNVMEGGKTGRRRALAVLTRNQAGVGPVLKLLRIAGVAEYFSAIWTMPWDPENNNGAYRDGEVWYQFNPPINAAEDFKPDVLQHVSSDPHLWFPQLQREEPNMDVGECADLRLEHIVLVDDERANFQSEATSVDVLRYVKVARYDATYRDFGLIKDMGGIGAHSDFDYQHLQDFCDEPWMYPETHEIFCFERPFIGSEMQEPVHLVVFDFDETLTMATFMPQDSKFHNEVGWKPLAGVEQTNTIGSSVERAPSDWRSPRPDGEDDDDDSFWTIENLLQYNFLTPFVQAEAQAKTRLDKLRSLLRTLARSGSGISLAVLTRNERGAFSALNLLLLSGLAKYFCVIWTLPAKPGTTSGLYQYDSKWEPFETPGGDDLNHKADVLKHVRLNPEVWFPQLGLGPAKASDAARSGKYMSALDKLKELKPESIVLVDDERSNCVNSDSGEKMIRWCKVARYDKDYLDCGPLNQMGGIGAHTDSDYKALRRFIQKPWEYSYTKLYGRKFSEDGGEGDGGKLGDEEVKDLSRNIAPPTTGRKTRGRSTDSNDSAASLLSQSSAGSEECKR